MAQLKHCLYCQLHWLVVSKLASSRTQLVYVSGPFGPEVMGDVTSRPGPSPGHQNGCVSQAQNQQVAAAKLPKNAAAAASQAYTAVYCSTRGQVHSDEELLPDRAVLDEGLRAPGQPPPRALGAVQRELKGALRSLPSPLRPAALEPGRGNRRARL